MTIKVKLKSTGREYLHYPVSGLPTDLTDSEIMEIIFPPETNWVEMEWVINSNPANLALGLWSVWDGVTDLPTHSRILLAGPDAGFTEGVILPMGSTYPDLRFLSSPEVIVRDSPVVIVVTE